MFQFRKGVKEKTDEEKHHLKIFEERFVWMSLPANGHHPLQAIVHKNLFPPQKSESRIKRQKYPSIVIRVTKTLNHVQIGLK